MVAVVANVFDTSRWYYRFEAPAQTGTRIGFLAPPRRISFNVTYDW